MYVSCVTHDLKNPLNSILGTIDFLKNSPSFLQEEDKNMLLTASYSGQILLYLIGNILDAAKIGAGRFDVDRIPMNIAEEIIKISKIEQEIAKPKGINLHKKILNPLPKLVFGDPMRFTQILINIIGNAIKFTTLGYVAIVARWAKDAQEAKEGYIDHKLKIAKNESEAVIPQEDFFQNDIGAKKAGARILTPRPSIIRKEGDFSPSDTLEDDINENLEETVQDRLQRYHPNFGGLSKGVYQTTELPPIITINSEKKEKRCSIDNENQRGYTEEISSTNISSYHSGIFGDSGFLVIEIMDTGPGMTLEEQKKLFQPFAQANSAVKRKFGGTGLGLWITKQLVNLMCGLIEVHSKPRVGTVFQITIPFKVVETEESSPRIREEIKKVKPLSQLNPFSTFLNSTPDTVTHLRTNGKFECKGSNGFLKGLKILILEEGLLEEDNKLEQVMKQMSSYTCELYHSIYSNGPLIIKTTDFRVAIILAGTSVIAVKKIITLLQKALKEKNDPSFPLIVISGI
jgi:signal transduction histidine kinase